MTGTTLQDIIAECKNRGRDWLGQDNVNQDIIAECENRGHDWLGQLFKISLQSAKIEDVIGWDKITWVRVYLLVLSSSIVLSNW